MVTPRLCLKQKNSYNYVITQFMLNYTIVRMPLEINFLAQIINISDLVTPLNQLTSTWDIYTKINIHKRLVWVTTYCQDSSFKQNKMSLIFRTARTGSRLISAVKTPNTLVITPSLCNAALQVKFNFSMSCWSIKSPIKIKLSIFELEIHILILLGANHRQANVVRTTRCSGINEKVLFQLTRFQSVWIIAR